MLNNLVINIIFLHPVFAYVDSTDERNFIIDQCHQQIMDKIFE